MAFMAYSIVKLSNVIPLLFIFVLHSALNFVSIVFICRFSVHYSLEIFDLGAFDLEALRLCVSRPR